jgi:phospholipid/cholesterol/gamma-HCH transport system substrate-binding protein
VKPDAHYLLVGLFVLAGVAVAVWLVFWLAVAGQPRTDRPIDMVFRDSVHGLVEGSLVQFMGITVGSVASVRLVGGDPPLVRVRAHVRSDTPIGPGTRASVEAELITGIAQVRLAHSPEAPAFYHGLDPAVEEIATRPDSLMGAIDQLPALAADAADLMARAQRLLSDDNLARVEQTLEAVENLASAVAGQRDRIDRLLSRATEAAAHLRGSAESAEEVLEALRPHLTGTARSAEQVAAMLQDWLERHQEPLESFVEEGLGQAGDVVQRFQRALTELERLGRRLGQDPSRMVFPEAEDAIELPP